MSILGKFPMLRIKQIITHPKYVGYFTKRFLVYKKQSVYHSGSLDNYSVLSPRKTIEYIIDHNMSLIRYGDGEYGMMTGAGIFPPDSDWSQRYHRGLKDSLHRQINLQNPNILIAHIAPDFMLGTAEHSIASMHIEGRQIVSTMLEPDIVYGHSGAFVPPHNKDFPWVQFSNYLVDKTVVIISGGVNKMHYPRLGAKQLYIETGKHDAYRRITMIIQSFNQLVRDHQLAADNAVCLISLGCSAGILVEEISKQGYVAWDTGHFFRYANDRITYMDGYVKTFDSFSAEQTDSLYQKHLRLHERSQAIENINTVRPLSCSGNQISYEYCDIETTLGDMLFRGSTIESEQWFNIGDLLAWIHQETAHGDFVCKNICVTSHSLVFFDACPPDNRHELNEFENYNTLSRERELGTFIFSMIISSSYKKFWKLFQDKSDAIVSFVQGYQRTSGAPISTANIEVFLQEECVRWKEDWGLRRPQMIFKYFVIRCAVWMQLKRLHSKM